MSLGSALTTVSFSSKQQRTCPSRALPYSPESMGPWLAVAWSAELRGIGVSLQEWGHAVSCRVLIPLRSLPLVCCLISNLARLQCHGSSQETRCFRRRDWMYSRAGASSVLYLKVPSRIWAAVTGSRTPSSSEKCENTIEWIRSLQRQQFPQVLGSCFRSKTHPLWG